MDECSRRDPYFQQSILGIDDHYFRRLDIREK